MQHPKLDKGSKKMLEAKEERKAKPTYERLYGMNEGKKRKKYVEEQKGIICIVHYSYRKE